MRALFISILATLAFPSLAYADPGTGEPALHSGRPAPHSAEPRPPWRLKGPYTVTDADAPRALPVSVDEGFCYLTHVSGKFAGSGEIVEVYIDQGQWMLKAARGGAGSDIKGTAWCVEWEDR